MTLIIECDLSGSIHWHVRASDPDSVPLGSLPGCAIVNPLLATVLSEQMGAHVRSAPTVLWFGHDAMVRSSNLLVSVDSSDWWTRGDNIVGFSTKLAELLRRLRIETRQASVPTEIPSLVEPRPVDLTAIVRPLPPNPSRDWRIVGFSAAWSATLTDAYRAGQSAEAVHPYHELLLDAMEGAIRRNFRLAILYAAMAMETLADTELDSAYAAALDAETPDVSLRIREYPRGGGGTERKDAVFRMLRDRERFPSLMHELPLYLTGRSLFLDNHALFQRAVKLYSTRNKIVHKGMPPQGDSFLSLDWTGAEEGLDTAIAVFNWFGQGTRYVNPLERTFLRPSAALALAQQMHAESPS